VVWPLEVEDAIVTAERRGCKRAAAANVDGEAEAGRPRKAAARRAASAAGAWAATWLAAAEMPIEI